MPGNQGVSVKSTAIAPERYGSYYPILQHDAKCTINKKKRRGQNLRESTHQSPPKRGSRKEYCCSRWGCIAGVARHEIKTTPAIQLSFSLDSWLTRPRSTSSSLSIIAACAPPPPPPSSSQSASPPFNLAYPPPVLEPRFRLLLRDPRLLPPPPPRPLPTISTIPVGDLVLLVPVLTVPPLTRPTCCCCWSCRL